MFLKEIRKVDNGFNLKYKYCFNGYNFTYNSPFLLKVHSEYNLLNILEVFIYRSQYLYFILFLLCFFVRPLNSIIVNISMNIFLIIFILISNKYRKVKDQNFQTKLQRIKATIILREYIGGETSEYRYKVSYNYIGIKYQPYESFTFYSASKNKNIFGNYVEGDTVYVHLNQDFPEYIISDYTKNEDNNIFSYLWSGILIISLNLILFYDYFI